MGGHEEEGVLGGGARGCLWWRQHTGLTDV